MIYTHIHLEIRRYNSSIFILYTYTYVYRLFFIFYLVCAKMYLQRANNVILHMLKCQVHMSNVIFMPQYSYSGSKPGTYTNTHTHICMSGDAFITLL